MNGLDYKDYFVHPVDPSHRRYEALRAVVMEEQSMQEVAQRFEVSYGTVRNWVSEFCKTRDADQSPPFLLRHRVDVPLSTIPTKKIQEFKSPMFESCH